MTNEVSQITLVTGIMNFISVTYPNLDVNTRHYNSIITAATTLADSLNTPHQDSTSNIGLEAWLQTDEVGMSSLFLAHRLSESPLAICEYAHPYDIDDFMRCRRMLEAIPELKQKLGGVSNESKIWSGLVKDWEAICQFIDDDKCEQAYSLIVKNH
jgi:hypothetical protein